jgi:cytochrome c553
MAGLLVVLGAAAGPAFADDPSVDRLLASQCAQCHGTDGRAVGEIDSLAGKSFSGLFGDTREMKDKDPDDIMHRQARGYSDDQLRRIAEYFSMLPEKEK